MQIIPMKDLRDTNALSEKAHARREPIFVTKNGYGDLVVMSIDTYEQITGTSEIDNAIYTSEQRLAAGEEMLDAREALDTLRRKHFG